MKVIGFDEYEHNWNLNGYIPKKNQSRPRSAPHKAARALLQSMFPLETILEEVFLPGCIKPLYVDFYLPNYKLGVEVHGQQHYKFTEHFHKDRLGFLEALKRDRKKAEWFSINNLKLVVLPDNEDENEWRRKIHQGTIRADE